VTSYNRPPLHGYVQVVRKQEYTYIHARRKKQNITERHILTRSSSLIGFELTKPNVEVKITDMRRQLGTEMAREAFHRAVHKGAPVVPLQAEERQPLNVKEASGGQGEI